MNPRKNIYTDSMRQVKFCWKMITTNRIVFHYNTGWFGGGKGLFTEQLCCSYWRDSICCRASLIQGQTFANPKRCVINNFLLQQIPVLLSSTNPSFLQNWIWCLLQSFTFCIGFCFRETGFAVPISPQCSQNRKSDFLLIQSRSHFKYHQGRKMPCDSLCDLWLPFSEQLLFIHSFIVFLGVIFLAKSPDNVARPNSPSIRKHLAELPFNNDTAF